MLGTAIGSLVIMVMNTQQAMMSDVPSRALEASSLYVDEFPVEEQCQMKVKGYHAVTCPVWYDESDPEAVEALDPISKSRGIDFRVRYIYEHQYPQDCNKANYYVNSFHDCSPINSIRHVLGRGLWGARVSDRVCPLSPSRVAIFLPLSHYYFY